MTNYGSKYWRRKKIEYILCHGPKAWQNFVIGRRQKKYFKTPKGRYNTHKMNAKKRGVVWEFTFETWWKKWQDSGKWELRGNKKGRYVMARIGDSGPYSPTNTHIVQHVSNSYASAISSGRRNPSERSEYWTEVAQIL